MEGHLSSSSTSRVGTSSYNLYSRCHEERCSFLMRLSSLLIPSNYQNLTALHKHLQVNQNWMIGVYKKVSGRRKDTVPNTSAAITILSLFVCTMAWLMLYSDLNLKFPFAHTSAVGPHNRLFLDKYNVTINYQFVRKSANLKSLNQRLETKYL